jgi:hypothetical protein
MDGYFGKEGLTREWINRASHELILISQSHPDFLVNMSASADVLAMAKVEVDLSTIPEGKNVGYSQPVDEADANALRSSSNGEASQSSCATEQQMRSRKPKASRSRHCVTPRTTQTESRSLSGWSWLVSAHTWDVCPLVRLETSEDGSVPATDPTTIFLDV